MRDIIAARADFPILQQKINDYPLCYLDSAASAQKPQAVIDAMVQTQSTAYANVHRGLHHLANKATENFENARTRVRHFIGAEHEEEIIFTSGATEGINLVASSFLEPDIKAGDEIIISQLEHHSNIVPWHFLRERKGAVLKWIPIDGEGQLNLEAAEKLFSANTKMLALTQTSNVLGIHTPLKKLIALARAHNVPVLVDGCQGVVHQKTDVKNLDCDFYVFSAHKIYGATGIGVLYGKRAHLEVMRPFQGGGEMIAEVAENEITYGNLPHRFEAGTPPIVEAVGLAATLDYVAELGFEQIAAYEKELYQEMLAALQSINHIELLGCATTDKAPIISFTTKLAHPHDIAQLLDQQGVAIRAGHHCAQPLMTALGTTATARASLALYNNKQDIAQLAKALQTALNFFI